MRTCETWVCRMSVLIKRESGVLSLALATQYLNEIAQVERDAALPRLVPAPMNVPVVR